LGWHPLPAPAPQPWRADLCGLCSWVPCKPLFFWPLEYVHWCACAAVERHMWLVIDAFNIFKLTMYVLVGAFHYQFYWWWFSLSTRLHLVDWISGLVDGDMIRDKLLWVELWVGMFDDACLYINASHTVLCRIYTLWKSFRDLPKYVKVSVIISVFPIRSNELQIQLKSFFLNMIIINQYRTDQEILDWQRGSADDLSHMYELCDMQMYCMCNCMCIIYVYAYENLRPYPRQSLDYIDDGCYKDLLNDIGFLFAIRQVLRVHEGGLAYFGMPCNSFSFMSKSLHGRTPKNPWGHPCFVFVQQGNILGARMCLLLALCVARGIRFMVENPDRSAIGFFPYLAHLMSFPDLKPERVFWWGPQILH
jgi:hypothetical protein